jgi:hypothetical protein
VEINLRKEASNVNAPSFAQIAYQVSTDKDKLSYRIALAEYFSEFQTKYISNKISVLLNDLILCSTRQIVQMVEHELEKQGRKLPRREFEMDILVEQCVQNSQSA